MNKKDMILIAVVINAGLLAMLFATAIIHDSDHSTSEVQPETAVASRAPAEPDKTEEDTVLKYYTAPAAQILTMEPREENAFLQAPTTPPAAPIVAKTIEEPPAKPASSPPAPAASTAKAVKKEKNEPVYYVVKKGDSPWKISRQQNVSYDEILRLNQLDEEKARNLKVGDRIRIK